MTVVSRTGFIPCQGTPIKPVRKIAARHISVVVPVKDNQSGVNRLLNQLGKLTPVESLPNEVILVDNNSESPLNIEGSYPFEVSLVVCKTLGPAAARNAGAKKATGSWLLFLDSDCIPTASTITGYEKSNNRAIAFAGNVSVNENCSISSYYSSQETLIPPKTIQAGGVRPDYLITANCLVSKEAFDYIEGFDEAFQLAGGEDVDLGFRLLAHGTLEYCWESTVEHDFSDGYIGFVKRFVRYGRGNFQVAHKHELDLVPKPFVPVKKELSALVLSIMQFVCMSVGFHKQKSNNSMQPTPATLGGASLAASQAAD